MENILFIEDDAGIRESITDILELAGYNVTAAKDGKEGLEYSRKQDPDLILCDINMPYINGYELLEALKNEKKEEIIPPFIFLTAKIENTDIRKGMTLGADDYLTKPISHMDLLLAIRNKLNKRRQLELSVTKEEQIRISDELHDNIQQLLSAAYMGFNIVEMDLDQLSDKKREIFRSSKEFIKIATDEIRNISHNYSQDMNIDLEQQIKNTLNHLHKSREIVTIFNYDVDSELEYQFKHDLLRIVKEATNNVIKYTAAKKLSVDLVWNKNLKQLLIKDNGKGFDLNNIKEGKGLRNMRKRALRLSSIFEIESIPGKGTSIKLAW